MLLKVVLFAYPRGITSSRTMARACMENVVFIALACDQQPHVTTLAHFVSTLGNEVEAVFRDVLMVCNAQGLIGRGLLAFQTPAATSHIPVGRVRHRRLQAAVERL